MKEHRLRHIFAQDRRTVILACDHAGFMGPLPGLKNPGKLLDQAARAGVDAVLTTMGVARRYVNHFGNMGLILRVDGGSSQRNPKMGDIQLIFDVEDAVRVGADAVACMGMIGYPEESSSLRNLTRLAAQSEVWGMPLLAEMLVKGQDGPATAEDVGFAMRIGVELGADLIKAPYAEPAEGFRDAVSACYRPVVVLGGARADDEAGLLESVVAALASGASGVAIGRNIWQYPNPGGMCRALTALVHDGATVPQAMEELKV